MSANQLHDPLQSEVGHSQNGGGANSHSTPFRFTCSSFHDGIRAGQQEQHDRYSKASREQQQQEHGGGV